MQKTAFEEARSASLKIDWQERLLLLEYVTAKSLPDLVVDRASLTTEQKEQLIDLMKRREEGTPLEILVGTAPFLDFELEVRPGVFIPRPETAQLVERTVAELNETPKVILELCTGTGAIAIALARRFHEASLIATDLAPVALRLAERNAERMKIRERIRFVIGNLFGFEGASKLEGKLDLLISNPPYIPTGLLAELAPEVRNFDPLISLDGGPDGFRVTERILDGAERFLSPKGLLALEIDPLLYKPLERYAETSPLQFKTGVDSYGNLRFLFVRR
ncbi:MAG: peptide chain release factor N(5)-glutamine methyltransferase [candidate division WOR-3 bacterium]|nr:peptide chain release factor N(5)-glutamine methyltransferase [candidate division WOR-3 bacterium]